MEKKYIIIRVITNDDGERLLKQIGDEYTEFQLVEMKKSAIKFQEVYSIFNKETYKLEFKSKEFINLDNEYKKFIYSINENLGLTQADISHIWDMKSYIIETLNF